MRLPLLLSTATATAAALFVSTPSVSQNATVCLAKQTKGKASGNHQFTLVVPKGTAATLMSRGFSNAPCRGRDKTVQKLRNQMCKLAAQNMPEAEDSFEQIYSVRPAEICRMSKQVLGEN